MSNVYGTADDGTPLTWDVVMPAGKTKAPWILTIDWAHWVLDNGVDPAATQAILAAGYAAVHPKHRLAPGMGGECTSEPLYTCGKIAGQVGNGMFPQGNNDLEMAVAAAKRDPRCDGRVGAIGGSGGGYGACWLQSKGLVFAAVALSPATQLIDLVNGGGVPAEKGKNFCAATDYAAASPALLVSVKSSPLYLAAFVTDLMPAGQYTDMVNVLNANGVVHTNVLIAGSGHSWAAWPSQQTAAMAFFAAHLPPLGSPSPTPTATASVSPTPTPSASPIPTSTPGPHGLSALIGGGKPVDPAIRSSPSVDMISLRVPWWQVEPTKDGFDFSYFKTEIAAALAINPKMQFDLLVQSGDGSKFFHGFKPDWLFPLIGAPFDSHTVVPGVTFSFSQDGGTTVVTIPVFWNDTLKARKHALLTAWGKWRDGLPKDQHDAIKAIRISYVNGNGEDWYIPDDDVTPDLPGNPFTQAQRWLEEAGYTTQKMIDTGVDLFAAANTAFPDLPIGHAIAQNGSVIDKAAADAASDTDVQNYLARSINKLIQAAHPGKVITQKNGIAANTITAEKAALNPKGGYGLFYQIAQTGAPVAGQSLWPVFGDPLLLMNGRTRDDHDYTGAPPIPQLTDDQILERSGTRLKGYKAVFYEVYAKDVLGLPVGTAFIHDLFSNRTPTPTPTP